MNRNFYIWSLIIFFFGCKKDQVNSSAFISFGEESTGISFTNTIEDKEDFNILEYLYFYNGGGVAIGDVNNDQLPDIYFTSNQGHDQLYINKGNLKFELANDWFDLNDLKGWSTGVTMIDLNADGWLDIYVSRLGDYKIYKDHNRLFINQQGKGFEEQSKEYGLDFSGFGTHAAFFDYDRDGDLDCYLLNHSVKDPAQYQKSVIRNTKNEKAGDLFLENNNGQFIDVTNKAGIYSAAIGFGLGVDIADLNDDGWPDIYVSNDFHEQDYLYLNQKDKSFKEVITNSTSHTSNFSMGCTISDFNNDGQADILSLDMKPFDDDIYKKSGGWESLEIYNFKRTFGYHHQSPRNALQIYQGNKEGVPIFSEQAALKGIAATDWSWSPTVADFDNDGDNDVFITNGIWRRPNDMDFINFHFNDNQKSPLEKIDLMPKGEVPNVYFQNDGNQVAFNKRIIGKPSCTTGAAVADLDLDGNLELVLNHINQTAEILKFNDKTENHFIKFKLQANDDNLNAIGARINLFQKDKVQSRTISSSSQFQSCNQALIHFGLGQSATIDSIIIFWPDGGIQKESNLKADSIHIISQRSNYLNSKQAISKKLKYVKDYQHQENNYNDQAANKWRLFNESNLGPRLVDMRDGNIFVTGNKESPAGFIFNGVFNPLNLKIETDQTCACLLMHQDQEYLYIGHGGNQYDHKNPKLQDELYKYENGKLVKQTDLIIPQLFRNTSSCAVLDFDNDGIEDLVIGNTADPKYGTTQVTYLLNYKDDVFLRSPLPIEGNVTAIKVIDLDNNGFDDVVVAGHWLPISILYNDGKEFIKSDIPNSEGLWFSLEIRDINNDGDLDILAGNFGLNHGLNVSPEEPMQYYLSDFDKNGQTEALITYYHEGKELPYPNQQLFTDQLPFAKKDYLRNEDYVNASVKDLIGEDAYNNAKKGIVKTLNSTVYFQNSEGWTNQVLPLTFQSSPMTCIGFAKDIFYTGFNYYEVDPNLGRQDAGFFSALSFNENDDELNILKTEANLPLINGEMRDMIIFDSIIYLTINKDSISIFAAIGEDEKHLK